MDWQAILVGLIIIAALFYAGKRTFKKAKSFSAKTDCGADCGCGGGKSKVFSARRQ